MSKMQIGQKVHHLGLFFTRHAKIYLRKRLLIILYFIFIYSCAISQPYFFENYSSEKGLSQNSCYSIAQDSDGFMWFGTQDGLNRFDGKSFKVYLPDNNFGKNLPSNLITALNFNDSTKTMWIGTYDGLCFYDLVTNKIKKVTEIFPGADTLEQVDIKRILAINYHEYWITTFSSGLINFNSATGKIQYFLGDETENRTVNDVIEKNGRIIVAANKHLYGATPVKSGYHLQKLLNNFSFPEIKELIIYEDNLWVGTLSGDCFVINDPWNQKENVDEIKVSSSGIGCFVIDAVNQLWIGTRGGGIAIYNSLSEKIQLIKNDKFEDRSLSRNFLLSIFKDKQQLIWCGVSGGGVAKYDPMQYQFKNFANEPDNENSLPDNMVFKLQKTNSGDYIIGTQNSGITTFNPGSGKFYNHVPKSAYGTISNAVYDITTVGNELWIASWGGLVNFKTASQKMTLYDAPKIDAGKKLYCLAKLNKYDSIIMGGENGIAFFSLKDNKILQPNESVINNTLGKIRHIFEDSENNLWLCTMRNGLVKFNYAIGNYEIIEPVYKYTKYVRHLIKVGSFLWLATDNGILIYDIKSAQVLKQIKLANDEGSNVCYAILQDDEGYFWVGTNTGLYKIDPNTYKALNYNLDNGLSFLEYNTACALKEDNGNLWFGGVGGITVFNPKMLKINQNSPQPIITKIEIDGDNFETDQSISHLNKINLSYKQNFFTIYFAVTNFSNNYKNSFRYKLNGIDEKWIESGTRNFANYTKLNPGTYLFQFQSANSNNIWCKNISTLEIEIEPAWYQTWWFKALLLLSIVTSVYYAIKKRTNNIQQRAYLKQQIAETEMAALKAQMNPHFMFNCINSIDAFIQTNDKYNATLYLNKFAKLIRNVLDSSKQNVVLFSKDIDTLKLYLELEELRSENKFEVHLNIEDELLNNDYKVPPLIIQPFVENAIIHGLRNRTGNNGLLTINVSKTNEGILYSISDNGIGRKAAEKINTGKNKSYGLEMSYERIKLFNKETIASVVFTDLYNNDHPSGTQADITLKIV